jgi:hypothetical protein
MAGHLLASRSLLPFPAPRRTGQGGSWEFCVWEDGRWPSSLKTRRDFSSRWGEQERLPAVFMLADIIFTFQTTFCELPLHCDEPYNSPPWPLAKGVLDSWPIKGGSFPSSSRLISTRVATHLELNSPSFPAQILPYWHRHTRPTCATAAGKKILQVRGARIPLRRAGQHLHRTMRRNG